MSNFQNPYQKIAWLQRRLDALESMVRRVITPGGVTNSGTTGGPTVVGVLENHQHSGTGEGGATLQPSILKLKAAVALTIASDAITVTQSHHTVDTEAAAASDNLATINGLTANQIYVIRPANDARTIVIKNGSGNIDCIGGADISLDDVEDWCWLFSPDGTRAYAFGDTQGAGGSHDHTTADGTGPATNTEFDGFTEWVTIADPSTPAATKVRLFQKADGSGRLSFYYVDPGGTVRGPLAGAHDHSTANSSVGGGSTLSPGTLNLPVSATPAPTSDGQAIWDSNDNWLTIGDGAATKIFLPTIDATSDPLPVAAAAADGTEGSVARKDHVHRAIHSDISTSGLKSSLMLMAASGKPTTTSGCAAAQLVEAGTNDIDYWVLDMDATTKEYAVWNIIFPENWDAGTITYKVYWTTTSSTNTHTAVFGLQGLGRGDSETIDTAYGSAVEVSDDATATANQVLISAESAAVTIGGTVAAGDWVALRLYRDPANGSDDLNVDARVLGVRVEFGITALSA